MLSAQGLLRLELSGSLLHHYPYHDVIIFAEVKQGIDGGAALGREILEESCDELGRQSLLPRTSFLHCTDDGQKFLLMLKDVINLLYI